MLTWKSCLVGGICLLGIGDAAPSDVSNYIQFGALGILGVAVIKLFSALKDQQEINDKLATRQDGWEKMRHDDHSELNATLRAMTANCAAVEARREGREQA